MFDIDKVINKLLIRFPIFKVFLKNLEKIETKSVNTAAVNGKSLYYNSEFFSSISKDEQMFVIAHELMHVSLKHISRMKNKNKEAWNYATDAVINQILVRNGLKIPDGLIDVEDAINYSAEEYYDIIINRDDFEDLMKQYRHEDKELLPGEIGNTTHEYWDDNQVIDKELPDIDEKKFDSINKDLIHKENEEYKDNLANKSNSNGDLKHITDIGTSEQVINWEQYLRKHNRKIISADYNLSNGYFDEEGIYQYPYEVIRGNEVEILIDTSGSVSEELVKAFLRECKNILANAKIKIGCFDTKFYGFHEIKNLNQIDNFEIQGFGGTDFDVAINAFSSKCKTKIIFTDGYAEMPSKRVDAIWIVYSNGHKINPPGGKVFYVDENEFKKSNGHSR